MGEHRKLSDNDIKKLDKSKKPADWNGEERRFAINSFVEPYHERRRIKDNERK